MTLTKTPAALWLCLDLPLWVRVVLYAMDHHRQDLEPGELRTALAPHSDPSVVYRAIRRGVAAGLLTSDSSARCLYVRVTP